MVLLLQLEYKFGTNTAVTPVLLTAWKQDPDPQLGTFFTFYYYFILLLLLFYFILFYFILFYFILFYFISFHFILFYFILFYYHLWIYHKMSFLPGSQLTRCCRKLSQGTELSRAILWSTNKDLLFPSDLNL